MKMIKRTCRRQRDEVKEQKPPPSVDEEWPTMKKNMKELGKEKMLKLMLRKRRIPEECKTGISVTTEDNKECSNSRGLTILCIAPKLMKEYSRKLIMAVEVQLANVENEVTYIMQMIKTCHTMS